MSRWIGIFLILLAMIIVPAMLGCVRVQVMEPTGVSMTKIESPEPVSIDLPLGERSALSLMSPWGPSLPGHAARQSTWDKTGANSDNIQIMPGETATLLDVEGPGIVRHIWITTNAPEPASQTTLLRMYWDGAESPSVEVPLGDFFAVGHGMEADVMSFPVTVNSEGRSRNCWWPMPFADGAKITVTNDGAEPNTAFYCYVDYLALDAPPPTKERFHAQYRQWRPADFPENLEILATSGAGHYVGTVYSVESTEPNWWGEGDDLIEVDGCEPLRGTGTEDYFNDAWGTRVYHQPWHGTSVCEGYDAAGLRSTCYRWHIVDPIPFQESIRVSIEHGTGNDRADNFSTVAFWYQTTLVQAAEAPGVLERLATKATMDFIRGRAFQLATGGYAGMSSEEIAANLDELLARADEEHGHLLHGLKAYAESQGIDGEDAEEILDKAIAALREIVESMPEDQRYAQAEIDLPTDSDAPVPSYAVEMLDTLERVRHALLRRRALQRVENGGGLELGDEIVVEARNTNAQATPAPAFECTKDWNYSYAKTDDTRLMGRGAQFTYGDSDPSWARFTPDFPQDGRYEVLVIFSYGSNAGDTRWEIQHADGREVAPLAQRGRPDTVDADGAPNRNHDTWHSLGVYRFETGQDPDKGALTLNAAPGLALPNENFEYRAYIDAARLVYRGD